MLLMCLTIALAKADQKNSQSAVNRSSIPIWVKQRKGHALTPGRLGDIHNISTQIPFAELSGQSDTPSASLNLDALNLEQDEQMLKQCTFKGFFLT